MHEDGAEAFNNGAERADGADDGDDDDDDDKSMDISWPLTDAEEDINDIAMIEWKNE